MQFQQFAEATLGTLPIRAKTLSNYQGAFRRYLEPALGQLELCEVTQQQVREVISPLSPQTGYQALMVLKTIFREAHNQGLVEALPTDRVRSARIIQAPQAFLRWEEIRSLDFGRFNNHVRFLALHGLRWGEASALEASDVRDGRVHVTKSIHGAPKSAAGVRSVPYLGYFEPFPENRYGLARALKLHGVTIHSLRRTYAYILKSTGVHVSTAQKLLGHASPHLTLAVYTAVLDDEIDQAGERIRMLL